MEPYLIQHKVRGMVAFDIAIKLMIGEEQGWVIPTSGHRAYPFWWRRLAHLCLISNADQTNVVDLAKRIPCPEDWPDHYPPPLPKGVKGIAIDNPADIHDLLKGILED